MDERTVAIPRETVPTNLHIETVCAAMVSELQSSEEELN